MTKAFPCLFLGKEDQEGQVYRLIPQETTLQARDTELSADCETAPGAVLWPVVITLKSLCHI